MGINNYLFSREGKTSLETGRTRFDPAVRGGRVVLEDVSRVTALYAVDHDTREEVARRVRIVREWLASLPEGASVLNANDTDDSDREILDKVEAGEWAGWTVYVTNCAMTPWPTGSPEPRC